MDVYDLGRQGHMRLMKWGREDFLCAEVVRVLWMMVENEEVSR